MTICIALICNNGSNAVLVTDSMITNVGLSIEFEHPTKKMTTLSQCCAALTAGDALADTELFNMVHQEIHNLCIVYDKEIVELAKERIERLDEIYKKWTQKIPKISDFRSDIEGIVKKGT